MGALMGGGVKTEAPNPELEAAQMTSIQHRMKLAQQQRDLSNEQRPMQMEQMKFGLDATRTSYEQTQQDRQYALTKRDAYDDALGGILNESQKFNEASRRIELGQQAAADVSKAFSGAQEQQGRQLSRMGVNPLSGKAIMAGQAGELDEARARAEASRMVNAAAREEGLTLKKSAVNMLSGFPAMASQLSPTSARLGWGGTDVANAGVGGLSAGNAAGSEMWGGVSENAGTMYNNQMNLASAANTANAENSGEVMGAAAGAASAYGASKFKGAGGKSGGMSNRDIESQYLGM